MDVSVLQQEVKAELLRRGFSQVRFARPPLAADSRRHFSEWMDQGMQGEMVYLQRKKSSSLDVDQLLEGCRSLIMMAHPYDTGLKNALSRGRGHVSRYAWGDDYHEVLTHKLRDFQAWLHARSGESHSFASVDASPVLEKAWARQAGLGWIGKHTNVIEEHSGSYFFLSALLTRIPFVADEPVTDRCGSCTQCMEVCPTRAIVAPYVLDARLCISYLTIELKGPIPRPLRPLIGNHIFGCDDCQEVCPWNRFSRPTQERRFFPRDGVRDQPLESFLSLSEADFKSRFAGSAILRAKRKGFLRNVIVAMGNSAQPEFAPLLQQKLEDPEPLIRGHAVWAYARLVGAAAGHEFAAMRARETDSWVLSELESEL